MAEKQSIQSLNLGTQRLGMASFSSDKNGALTLNNYQFSEILGDPTSETSRAPQVASAIKNLATQLRASKSSVGYVVSGQPVFSRFVKLPPLGEEKVAELIGFEAQQSIPFPLNEVIWDYQSLGATPTGEQEALLVAIKADALNEINQAVETTTMTTEVVDVAPLALYNAFCYNYPDLEQPALLIDLGARTTNLIYIEPNGRMFFRTVPNIGGASVTQSIAREFNIEYDEAEQRKTTSGFVALSGYADHNDPEIAAMSKVIRNALTRSHGEIVRTTNLYRSQQGGSAPEIIFLSGAGASLPYTKEFFEEKLNLPVEYFNALRNVQIGPQVDAEKVSRDAHCLGELVGVALRQNLTCPTEIDLVPSAVAQRRDNNKRKPYLYTAGAALLSLLGASGFYHFKAKDFYANSTQELQAKAEELKEYASKLAVEDNRAKQTQFRADLLTNIAQDRTYWMDLFKDINGLMKSDVVWITQIEPMSKNKPLTTALADKAKTSTFVEDEEETPVVTTKNTKAAKGGKTEEDTGPMIDAVHVFGLYRDYKNDKGAEVVTEFFNEIRQKSQMFDLPKEGDIELTKYLKTDSADGSKWAYSFEMKLPLKRKMKPVTLPKAGSD